MTTRREQWRDKKRQQMLAWVGEGLDLLPTWGQAGDCAALREWMRALTNDHSAPMLCASIRHAFRARRIAAEVVERGANVSVTNSLRQACQDAVWYDWPARKRAGRVHPVDRGWFADQAQVILAQHQKPAPAEMDSPALLTFEDLLWYPCNEGIADGHYVYACRDFVQERHNADAHEEGRALVACAAVVVAQGVLENRLWRLIAGQLLRDAVVMEHWQSRVENWSDLQVARRRSILWTAVVRGGARAASDDAFHPIDYDNERPMAVMPPLNHVLRMVRQWLPVYRAAVLGEPLPDLKKKEVRNETYTP